MALSQDAQAILQMLQQLAFPRHIDQSDYNKGYDDGVQHAQQVLIAAATRVATKAAGSASGYGASNVAATLQSQPGLSAIQRLKARQALRKIV